MAKAAAQNGAKGNGGGEAAVAAAASSSSSSSFEWIPGRLEVIPCHACLLHFDILTAGAAWLSKWDINHTVSQVAKDEPLYNDLTIGRDSASLAVGYATLEPVSKLMALDGRQVIISESQVTIRVRRIRHEPPAAALRPWKEHFFGGDTDASPTVLQELFQRAQPGKGRPDTLVIANLPLKWLSDEASPYATRAANAAALRGAVEAVVEAAVAEVEAVVPDAAAMKIDLYIRCHTLEHVERGFARLYGRALRFMPSGLTASVEVKVDMTGFYALEGATRRAEAEEEEMNARRQRQVHRQRLEGERAALQAWLEGATRRAEAEADPQTRESDLFDILQEQLKGLAALLEEAGGRDKDARHPGPEGVEALRALVEVVGRAGEARRKVGETEAHMDEDRQERVRLQKVREVRIEKAKQLKRLDERLRGVLDAAAEGVKGSALCAGLVEATQRALARARDLVLREAARIVNAQEYAEALEESLAVAERQAGDATRALQLQAQANAGQTGLAALLAEMRALGEHDPAAAATAAAAAAVVEGGEGAEEDLLGDVCFLRPFLASEAMQRSLRAAQAAMKALGETKQRRGAGSSSSCSDAANDPVETFAELAKELEAHYTTTLRPAWDRHSPILPWQRRLQAAVRAHGPLLLGTPALTEALRVARAALRRAVEERAAASPEVFHGLLCALQEGVEGVDRAVAEEKRRQREAEVARRREAEAAARRQREEEAAAREALRQEALASARLERLKRRRAFLQEGLGLERARESLKRARAAGVAVAPPEGFEADDKVVVEEGEEVVATGMRGSQAVVVEPRPVRDAERWPMPPAPTGAPLNLLCKCRGNDLSREFWAGAFVSSSSAAAPPAEEGEGDGGGRARLQLRLRGEAVAPAKRPRSRVLVVDTSAAMAALLPSPTAGPANGGGAQHEPGSGSARRKKSKKNKSKKRQQQRRGSAVVVAM